jgi:hypothetical protein
VPALRREIARAPADVQAQIRISPHLEAWVEEQRRHQERKQARETFLEDVTLGKRSLDLVRIPLYQYQQQGMLHLAFTERALLADEMGLGKTVQAIAACELLRRLRGIERVLVISPASLKSEWEEQIAKFTALPSLIIQGPRAVRLKQYRQPAFFYLMNYEQILVDGYDIQELIAPDVIILDEAQRIKNWQTKTANAVKRLSSRYAFVLTGTPLENRIDEIYSIAQFLDPNLFGPLFQFNRDFYQLDERGRPAGYKNLDELHRRLRPVMLRRRKEEVEGELPGRTVNTYFVSMVPEQTARYEEYNERVARLMAQARRRPLSKEEFEKLQKWLACMRMICDTPYILDDECRVSPKLHELDHLLDELLENADHKIIIFSEWERMLQLVRELAEKAKLGFAWHTGSTPQTKRRGEINRFKEEPDCRLFLSTDSGSVGLNLQAANIVINLDLPWNPARLEQRIARAWRKHQTRSVQVINLVCENSIEHRMLHMLEQKRTLAEGVVDGTADVTEMAMPSGRAAFVERVESLMGRPRPAPQAAPAAEVSQDPLERLREDTLARLSERLDLLQISCAANGEQTIVAVLDHVDESANAVLEQAIGEHCREAGARLEVLDRKTYDTVQRLIEAGVLSLSQEGARILHQSPAQTRQRSEERDRRATKARERFAGAERKRRMAEVLTQGGFAVEALAPLHEAVEIALQSLAQLVGEDGEGELSLGFVESRLVSGELAPPETLSLIARLREKPDSDESAARALFENGCGVLDHVAEALDRAALK